MMDTVQRGSMLGCGQAPGLRKLTPQMLGTIEVAETHRFTSDMHPGQVLAAFKAAAPYLGLRPSVVHAIDWLFRFTDAVDWQPSSRPIVWPSAAMQQQELGLGPSQVKNLNRYLVELGLVVMKDSPNGKRYGRRDPKGRIIEAYGFDLSPLASRYAEFQAAAEEGRKERARLQALKRRATIARNGIRQLLETAVEQGISGEEWETHRAASAAASRGIAGRSGSIEMEMAVASLERIQSDMRRCLEAALDARCTTQPQASSEPMNLNPKGSENWPHITTTNQPLNLKDTVVALRKSSSSRVSSGKDRPSRRFASRVETARATNVQQRSGKVQTDPGSLLKITPMELIKLAPRLKPYLTSQVPSWPEIVDAAEWLRDEMGISKFIWGDACLVMGREQAAIAVAVISAKPPTHFRGSPGGYFHGMVSKAKTGELHLVRTIWGMRGAGERHLK
ncbi:MAG TPA: plasmid replication protein RepC [Edaphobacter sp.]|nr:plasmid replication protein RepC [Edaphobacter sp.]